MSKGAWARPGQPGACHLQENNFLRLKFTSCSADPWRGRCFSLSLNKGRGYLVGWEGAWEERKRVSCLAGRGPAGPLPPSLGQIEPERPTAS